MEALIATAQSNASDVLNAVLKDIQEYYVEDTSKFLDKLMPIPQSQIEEIFRLLTQNNLYVTRAGRWKYFPPKKGGSEDKMYKPFVDIGNAVNDYILSKGWNKVSGRWCDVHSKAPKAEGRSAPSIRPDSAFASSNNNIKVLQDEIDKLENKKQALSRPESKELKKLENEMTKISQVWWLQVFAVVEMKTDPKESDDALLQLCGYMRQMFREQLDRRFTLGITLCFNELSVYLCDRSGVLGTRQKINIDENPRDLIRVIASFSMLEPHRLGWDTTMKFYCPELAGQSCPSYEFPFAQRAIGSLYQLKWVIQFVDESHSPPEQFLTVRAISIVGAEVMCGRASVVWEVVKLKDCHKPDKKVYVLKQGWQRFEGLHSIPNEPFEAAAHRTAELYKDRMYSSAHLRIGSELDTTLEHIRQGLGCELVRIHVGTQDSNSISHPSIN